MVEVRICKKKNLEFKVFIAPFDHPINISGPKFIY